MARSGAKPRPYHCGRIVRFTGSTALPPRIHSDQYGQERFDLVVGADGIGSVVRGRLNPGFTPRYLGYVAVRGLVPRRLMPSGMPDAMAELFDDAMAKVLLDGEHLTLYGLPGSDEPMNWMWYLNVAESELPRLLTDRDGVVHRWSVPAGVMPPATVAALGELAKERLPPWLTTLVTATDTLFLQPIYSGFACHMAGSGLALVGDAAHLAVPHTGGGVTLALQDTLALADVLAADDEELDTRLRRWDEARQAANRPRLEFAIRLGKSLQTAGKVWDSWSPADFEQWWTVLLADAPADPSR